MAELAKLKWHCRRGMRELDLLLEGFLEQGYPSLSRAGRDEFTRLLDCRNEDLMDWLMEGGTPEDGSLAELVQQIRDSATPRT